jgi:hypothetical protein
MTIPHSTRPMFPHEPASGRPTETP